MLGQMPAATRLEAEVSFGRGGFRSVQQHAEPAVADDALAELATGVGRKALTHTPRSGSSLRRAPLRRGVVVWSRLCCVRSGLERAPAMKDGLEDWQAVFLVWLVGRAAQSTPTTGAGGLRRGPCWVPLFVRVHPA